MKNTKNRMALKSNTILFFRRMMLLTLVIAIFFTTMIDAGVFKMGLLPSLVLGILGKGGKKIIPLPLLLPIPFKVQGRDISIQHEKRYQHIPVYPSPEFRQPADLTLIKPGGQVNGHSYSGVYHR